MKRGRRYIKTSSECKSSDDEMDVDDDYDADTEEEIIDQCVSDKENKPPSRKRTKYELKSNRKKQMLLNRSNLTKSVNKQIASQNKLKKVRYLYKNTTGHRRGVEECKLIIQILAYFQTDLNVRLKDAISHIAKIMVVQINISGKYITGYKR